MANNERDKVLADIAAGMSAAAAARKHGKEPATVRQWVRRYLKGKTVTPDVMRDKKRDKRDKRDKCDSVTVQGKKVTKVQDEGGGAEPPAVDSEKLKTNTPHPQARPGNQNAAGNKGGPGGPAGNRHAVTTGEYETITYAGMTDEEKALADAPFSKYGEQIDLLMLNRVRRHRMMGRISKAENTPGGMVIESVIKSKGIAAGQLQDSTQTMAEAAINRVMKIENALSRVIDGTQRGVMNYHAMETGDARTELAAIREESKLGSGDDESGDTNFVEALMGTAKEVWTDAAITTADAEVTEEAAEQ